MPGIDENEINEKRIWSMHKPERGSTGLLFSLFLFDAAWFFAGTKLQRAPRILAV